MHPFERHPAQRNLAGSAREGLAPLTHRGAAVRAQAGIFAAASNGGGVLMHLLADRYIGLDEVEFSLWNALSRGVDFDAGARLLVERHGFPAERARARVEACLDRWMSDGLIVSAGESSPPLPTPKPAGRPARRLWSSPAPAGVRPGQLVAVVSAARRVPRLQRRHGLAHTLWMLQQSFRPAPGAGGREGEAARVLAAYQSYRRLMRRGHDCLVHSLTVADLLRRRGFDAEICFGIKSPPFYAHAWVELEGSAVLDSLERLAAYTVIARF